MNNDIMVKQTWNYIIKPFLVRMSKRTTNQIDDFIIKIMEDYINRQSGGSVSATAATKPKKK